jgi:hypothetical protein
MAVSLLKPPFGGFRSETAVTRLTAVTRVTAVSEVQRTKFNGYIQRASFNGRKCPFGCNGHVTAVAVGQSQRLYSGVRMFTGNYPSLF